MSNITDFFIKDKMLLKYNGADSDVIIPDSVTTIRSGVFLLSPARVTSITVPDSVTQIVSDAFSYCIHVRNIKIGKKVKKIAEHFNDCSVLTNICVDSENPFFMDIDGNLYTKDGKTLIRYMRGKRAKSFIIPNHVTKIASYAFCRCNSLNKIIIPDSVTEIDTGAFSECENLKEITLPRIKTVSGGLISGCRSLTDFTIPDSVEILHSFDGADGLASITIPRSVGKIEPDSMLGVRLGGKSLSSIGVDKANENYKSADGNLYSKDGKTLIRYAVGKKDKSFEIPKSVTTIKVGAFCTCDNVETIIIPSSVNDIERNAFFLCKNLSAVVIPCSVEKISEHAFLGCEKLVIKGSAGSYAEEYAKENGIPFEAIEE